MKDRFKPVTEIMREVAEGNDRASCTHRLEWLGKLKSRVDEWVNTLAAREAHGPSAKLMKEIRDDLADWLEEVAERTLGNPVVISPLGLDESDEASEFPVRKLVNRCQYWRCGAVEAENRVESGGTRCYL